MDELVGNLIKNTIVEQITSYYRLDPFFCLNLWIKTLFAKKEYEGKSVYVSQVITVFQDKINELWMEKFVVGQTVM